MFRKVLVANRGEIAERIIRACHAVGAKAVAVYSTADADSPHLKLADETVCIGPGASAQSYLDADAIIEAALQRECQAVHPGFGFLSENAAFVTRCRDAKLTFVGPSAKSIRAMGDKATARRTMKAAGVPVMPGSKDVVRSVDEALGLAQDAGYPILLKATAGGGGRGMRRVNEPSQMQGAFDDAQREAGSAFGNPDLYMEKFIVGGRHIEFQILADHYGNVIHLGERECSIQRRNQKLLEEAPAAGMSDEQRAEIGETIRSALVEIGYRNAGTIEFLMDHTGALYFMEMNTRIQVEHPVTEAVTGVDLVAWQLRIAAGQKLTISQEDVTLTGHAIECRINAEDPAQAFRPSPGTVASLVVPQGDGVRWDSHIEAGYAIPTFYDSMLGKLIVHGTDRNDAIDKMRVALDELTIGGITTTASFHRALIRHPDFKNGGYNCQFIESSNILESLKEA